ncbi:MAG: right-handed parallel beta-helix repeat-containing protein [bacterium]|nr:right-handed parallel beta-helix repeat-containing protein [bacterium]
MNSKSKKNGSEQQRSVAACVARCIRAVLACVLLASGMGMAATTYYVSNATGNDASNGLSWATAKQTIQPALNLCGAGDTVLVSNGVFTLSASLSVPSRVRLTSLAGPAGTIVNGNAPLVTNRCVRVPGSSAGALIEGFTFTNGSTGNESGGGVLLEGVATVSNCVVSGNTAVNGAGIACNSTSVIMYCAITGNRASSVGGGIYLYRAGTVRNCLVAGNSASASAIFCENGGYVCDSVISNNAATSYAGVRMRYTGGLIETCTIVSNTAAGPGGGLGIDAGSTALCCVVTLNAATAPNADFGGVYCEGLIRSSLITRNRAYDLAGGLYVGVNGVAENCTISSNSAGGAYGGVRYDGLLRNAIVYDNSAPVAPNAAAIGSNAVCQFTCTLPLQLGDGNITNDPGFVNRALGDYHLGTDSPCINTGTNLAWMLTASDLDGNPRSIGGFVDMGCYETLPEPACVVLLLAGLVGLVRRVRPV